MSAKMQITSPAFEEGGMIPVQYTGHGEDVSPALRLADIPAGAKTMAVVMDDLDHPIPAYNHWIIWNLPVMAEIPEDIPRGANPVGFPNVVQGMGYGRQRYKGPKPPFNWRHRYRYAVYALDCEINLPPESRKRDLLNAMQGHVLGSGELNGVYQKNPKV